jgi:hypothetical protein
LGAQAADQSALAVDAMVGRQVVGDALVPAHPRDQDAASLKACCVATKTASWPSTFSLQHIVRMSVLFIQARSITGC